MRFHCAILSFLAASTLAAQAFSPAMHGTTEASYWAYTVLGDPTPPARYLQVHDDLPSPMTIRRIALRRDISTTGTGDLPAYTMLCNLWVSNAAVASSSVQATFDRNHGANKTQVRSQFAAVNFPASSFGPMPRPFEAVIPFTQSFAWNGSGSLAWELVLTSTTLTTARFYDYAYGTDPNPIPITTSLGTGCKTTSHTEKMDVTPYGSADWMNNTVTLTYLGNYFPASTVAYLSLGTSATQWGTLPLPFPLPGTATAPSGLCTIYNDSLATLPVLISASGTLNQNLVLTGVDRYYHGLSVFTQAVALDQSANSWGLVLSNGSQHQVLAPWTAHPVGNVYLTGSAGPNGTAQPGDGYVVRFD
jgi:hypothetical protein